MVLLTVSNELNNLTDISVANSAVTLWPFHIYLAVHVIALICVIILIFMTLKSPSSKAQTALVIFESGALIYTTGFIEEIISDTAEGGYISCISQYLGESIIFIAVVFFVAQICSVSVPIYIYIAQTVFCFLAMVNLCTTRLTGLFYKYISVNRTGMFSRPEIVHGTGFYIFATYLIVVCLWVFKIAIQDYKDATPYQKKRLVFLISALFICWIPYMLTIAGLTNGFEIPAVGITVAAVFLFYCYSKYGFFDSQALAGSTALEHGKEGILVIDSAFHVRYENNIIKDIFGEFPPKANLSEHQVIGPVLLSGIKTYEDKGKVYEFSVEPLREGPYTIGHIILVMDATEHYDTMRQIREVATRDTLTGLYNRTHFQGLVEADLAEGCFGTFVMFDMDNFKKVNDTYGHQCGDMVLKIFGNVLKLYSTSRLFSCRLGGDEFCIFIRNVQSRKEVENILSRIFKMFKENLSEAGFGGYTSLSAGASIAEPGKNFISLYSEADRILYQAKTTGKDNFIINI